MDCNVVGIGCDKRDRVCEGAIGALLLINIDSVGTICEGTDAIVLFEGKEDEEDGKCNCVAECSREGCALLVRFCGGVDQVVPIIIGGTDAKAEEPSNIQPMRRETPQ